LAGSPTVDRRCCNIDEAEDGDDDTEEVHTDVPVRVEEVEIVVVVEDDDDKSELEVAGGSAKLGDVLAVLLALVKAPADPK
jgi:hypothetical protein